MTEHRRAYGRKETAELLGISVKTVDRMVEDGTLTVVIIGRTPKITRASIDALLATAG